MLFNRDNNPRVWAGRQFEEIEHQAVAEARRVPLSTEFEQTDMARFDLILWSGRCGRGFYVFAKKMFDDEQMRLLQQVIRLNTAAEREVFGDD